MAKIENSELLNQSLEISVADIYLYEPKTGLELYSGTLESHELSKTVDTEEIKAGRNNDTICTITKNTDLSLKITDVCARQDIQALKLGGQITNVKASDNVFAMHFPENIEVKTVESKKIVTLPKEPIKGEEVAIYNNSTKKKLVEGTDYTYAGTGTSIEITTEEIKEGDTVYVTGYKYKVAEGTKYFDIKEGAMPVMIGVIELPLFDGDANIIGLKQYYFPRVKMDTSVTLSGSTEKTKSTDETTIKILKDPTVNYLGRVVFVEETE